MSSPHRHHVKRRRPLGHTHVTTPSPASSPFHRLTRIASESDPPKRQRTESFHSSHTSTHDQHRSVINIRNTCKLDLANKGLQVRADLGAGSYSKVKLVSSTTRKLQEMVAVKIVDRTRAPQDYLEHFLDRELRIWARLSHPNLVKLYDYFEASGRVYMLLEFVSEGDALSYVQKVGAVSEHLARGWMTQIGEAVRYMHDRNISHRDIKLENLLLTDHCMTVKLCDFGFVKEVSTSEDLSQTFCGSKAYAAPEILNGQAYDPKKSDIWAMGVILYILVMGKMPFDEMKGTKKILEDQQSLRIQWGKTSRISQRCYQLVLRMLTWDFKERPTIRRVQRDEWFLGERPSVLVEYGVGHEKAGARCYHWSYPPPL